MLKKEDLGEHLFEQEFASCVKLKLKISQALN